MPISRSLQLTSFFFLLFWAATRSMQSDCPEKQADDFFNRIYFRLAQNSTSYELFPTQTDGTNNLDPCHRHRRTVRDFSIEDVVRCLDSLSTRRQNRPMHIAFIGDSTVRLHFINFLRMLPDYDRQMTSESNHFRYYHFQEDRNVTFPLLNNLLVSFRWRPRFDEFLFDDFSRWSTFQDDSPAPDFILIGVLAHYFVRYDDEEAMPTYDHYKSMLENRLVPLINKSQKMNPNQEIVWLRQSRPANYRGPDPEHRWVTFEKIELYNQSIRDILRNTKVVIWDSINDIVEQQVRACLLMRVLRLDPTFYANCGDFYHAGLGSLSLGTQLIIHHLCADAVL